MLWPKQLGYSWGDARIVLYTFMQISMTSRATLSSNSAKLKFAPL